MNLRRSIESRKDPAVARADADFLKLMLFAVPVFVVRLDSAFRVRFVNRVREDASEEELIGGRLDDYIDRAFHGVHWEALEQVRTAGEPVSYAVEGWDAEGRRVHYDVRAVPVPEADGHVGIVLMAVDVTEHVNRAKTLLENEDKLRLAVDATGIGLWSWDLETDTVEWDQRVSEILGVERPVTPAHYVAHLVHPDDRAWVRQRIAQWAAGEVESFGAHRIVRPDGELRWVLPSGSLRGEGDRRSRRLCGGVLDVTDQRQAEERLQQAQKMEALGSLTAGVAHNFNNLLAVILPALEIAQRDVAPVRRTMVSDAIDAARRAGDLVNGLMAFAGQHRETMRQQISVRALVRSAIEMCPHAFQFRHRMHVGHIRPELQVECTEGAIEQVLVNLLVNAHDAVVEDGVADPYVSLEVDVVEEVPPGDDASTRVPFVRIVIGDNGVGMEPNVAERAFEPFFTTKPPGKGTGLGLATSYAIVHEHGGFLRLQTERGCGSTFALHLPLACSTMQAVGTGAGASHGERRLGRVLVIDDEDAIRTVIAHLLQEEGLEVGTAASVDSALDQLRGGLSPDLVLLDRSMPGIAGERAVLEIRRQAPRAAVLYFTGQDVPHEERQAVDGVLAKPLAADELLAAVRSYLPQDRT